MFTIRQPKTVAEFSEGLNLLSLNFQNRFKTYPRELPHQFFLAFDSDNGNRVAGTINLQVVRDGEIFEIERFFDCDVEGLCGVKRTQVGEIGRLTSVNDLITPYLFCAVGLFMRRFDIKTFISFNRKSIGRILKSVYRLPLTVCEFPMRKENIPAEYYSYFYDQHNSVIILKGEMSDVEEWMNDLMRAQLGMVEIEVPKEIDQLDQIIAEYNSL